MRNNHHDHESMPSQLKHLVVDLFRLDLLEPDKISDHEPLLDSLGLDSLDALELSLCIEEEFGITIGSREESRDAFASIASLAEFIRSHVKTEVARAATPGTALVPPQPALPSLSPG